MQIKLLKYDSYAACQAAFYWTILSRTVIFIGVKKVTIQHHSNSVYCRFFINENCLLLSPKLNGFVALMKRFWLWFGRFGGPLGSLQNKNV